jgi:hypothetical protein
MRNFSFPLLIGGLILIIILGILAYKSYIKPMYDQNMGIEVSRSITDTTLISFGKKKTQEDVFSVELELTGKTSKNLEIVLSNSEGPVHSALIKGGNPEFTYVNDWYNDSLFMRIIPKDGENGKVEVTCRFITL